MHGITLKGCTLSGDLIFVIFPTKTLFIWVQCHNFGVFSTLLKRYDK